MSRLGLGLSLYVGVLTIFLLAPVAVVIASAFTGAEFVTFPPHGVSLKWFAKVLGDPQFVVPLWNSLRLGVLATLLSAVLAIPAAIAMVRYRLPGADLIQAFLLSPLSLPTIILAVGLLFFVARIGIGSSLLALVVGHAVITVPYVLRTVLGVYAGINREIEEAAMVLGANPLRAFWLVTLPLIRPGILAGAIFSFLLSFDEVPVALLLSNTDTTTLPVSILSYLVYNYDPAVAAISTIQIAIVIAVLLVLERVFGVKHLLFTSR
ncbi:MAG TPA: ABC transporter permease [Alphaproteobacteria bacterium]|nr:ABC transporter permease [Alphaproteobacteria bacterium]